jgi:succinate dehydrogenase/fumarate reductase flavoprotein subunit
MSPLPTQERSEKEGCAVPERSYGVVVVGGGNAAMCAGLMAGAVPGRIAGRSATTVSRA